MSEHAAPAADHDKKGADHHSPPGVPTEGGRSLARGVADVLLWAPKKIAKAGIWSVKETAGAVGTGLGAVHETTTGALGRGLHDIAEGFHIKPKGKNIFEKAQGLVEGTFNYAGDVGRGGLRSVGKVGGGPLAGASHLWEGIKGLGKRFAGWLGFKGGSSNGHSAPGTEKHGSDDMPHGAAPAH